MPNNLQYQMSKLEEYRLWALLSEQAGYMEAVSVVQQQSSPGKTKGEARKAYKSRPGFVGLPPQHT